MTTALALPSIADARLPQTYEKARIALETCVVLDECIDWADKSAALASYAKQSKDEKLEQMAARIRARAIRRCGELLKQIEAKPEANLKRGESRGAVADTSGPTRTEAASAAGLSKRQQVTAVRVANVPAADFEAAVERPKPATVTALAERGKKSAPPQIKITGKLLATPPAIPFDLGVRSLGDFQISTHGEGAIRSLHERAIELDPAAVGRGLGPIGQTRMREQIPFLLGWLSDVLSAIEEIK